ncbi:cytochrome b [Vibrio sp. S9_S30]|uniref:cytochrome b n=1 Tax=Vibrio sp. S9_S30 TaxID=2720226 RepID=UPI001680242E|nr:cytochrome b [Vibrio sp. S9_S30]MBD1559032.1 cytochrome b [Vibrio sp. S9_S30]
MNNYPKNHSLTARIIHWVSALSVFGLFGVGLWMVDLTYYSEWYKTAPYWHKSIGLILAFVTLFRLVWKWVSAHPPIEGKAYEVLAAKLAHFAMYLLLFTLFTSGYLISTADGRGIEVFDWFVVPSMGELFANQPDIAGTIHYYAAFALIGLVAIHAAAALKHHFIDKDDTLRKMIGVSK